MLTPRPSASRRAATYPPPYPDAWYRLAGSHELRPGELRYVEALGTELVLYRSDVDGSVGAMGAFCPHLGANLASGCVKGGQVECPFHRWRFAADGRVAHIPYADKVPPRLRQRTWPVLERDRQVFVYHRSGASDPDAPAPYTIPEVPEIAGGKFVFRGTHAPANVHMHLFEFAENSVDVQHFGPLHGEMFVPWTDLKVPGVRIKHEASWEPDEDQPHIAYFRNQAVLQVLGRELPRTRASAKITFHGPGSVVTFHFTIPDAGEILMYQTHLPVAPMEQEVRFTWFADKRMPRALVSYVVGNWVSQWRNDIAIWEGKIHLSRPALAKGDGPIHRLRSWYRQFYPQTPEAFARISPAAAAPDAAE